MRARARARDLFALVKEGTAIRRKIEGNAREKSDRFYLSAAGDARRDTRAS